MPIAPTDADLVTALLSGESSALAAVYDRYAAPLYDTARAMLRDPDDAADVVQDVFVVTAQRIGQLRDPDRLKPWLFAILRNEVYRRTRKRSRSTATDFRAGEAEAMLPPTPSDDGNVEYDELASLVRDAAAGLDERDQFVLELSVRQGLTGNDLADALGVSAQESYNLVHRMRQRVERSLGALTVARYGRKDCPELAKILTAWDGTFSVLIRKRVARHIDDCEICERTRLAAAPLPLVAAAPVFAVPDGLRDRVLAAAGRGPTDVPYGFGAEGGFPAAVRAGRRLLLMFGLGAALLLAGGAGVAAWSYTDEPAASPSAPTTTAATPATDGGDDTLAAASSTSTTSPETTTTTTPAGTSTSSSTSSTTSTTTAITTSTTSTTTAITTSTTIASAAPVTTPAPATSPPGVPPPPPTTTTTPAPPPPPPGQLALSASNVDFGTTGTQQTLTLSNPGGQPVNWTVSLGPVGIVTPPFSVTPAGGTIAAGGSQAVTLRFDRNAAPEGTVTGSARFVGAGTSATVGLTARVARPPELQLLTTPPAQACARTTSSFSWRLSITDETEPISATGSVTLPSGATIGVTTRRGTSFWSATVTLPIDAQGFPPPGPYRWTITATDGLRLSTSSSGSTLLLPRC